MWGRDEAPLRVLDLATSTLTELSHPLDRVLAVAPGAKALLGEKAGQLAVWTQDSLQELPGPALGRPLTLVTGPSEWLVADPEGPRLWRGADGRWSEVSAPFRALFEAALEHPTAEDLLWFEGPAVLRRYGEFGVLPFSVSAAHGQLTSLGPRVPVPVIEVLTRRDRTLLAPEYGLTQMWTLDGDRPLELGEQPRWPVPAKTRLLTQDAEGRALVLHENGMLVRENVPWWARVEVDGCELIEARQIIGVEDLLVVVGADGRLSWCAVPPSSDQGSS
ncbi:MAG: hypothetical protein KC933_37165 [Myxococcales bacterium]|nr:hypothetical protein [Myxococcales bacterium]